MNFDVKDSESGRSFLKKAILIVVPALRIMASKTISMIGDSNERQISATLP